MDSPAVGQDDEFDSPSCTPNKRKRKEEMQQQHDAEIQILIEENNRLKERLQHLEEEVCLYESVFDTQDNLVVVMDPESNIIKFNQACQNATGFTLNEVKGLSIFDVLVPQEDNQNVQHVFDSLRCKQDASTDIMFPACQWKNFWKTKKGGLILTKWSNTSIRDELTGNIKFVISTGTLVESNTSARDEFLLKNVVHSEHPS